jgi:RNA-directed DNA polymerase
VFIQPLYVCARHGTNRAGEQFFDKVNHDKLIQILREQVNDSSVLNLIRKYLRAGVMEKGIAKATKIGVPQGGPL